MSAPTSADGGPAAGYYPDPSIPGYVRYWNGAAWVPGTSMPAPPGSEAAAQASAPGPAAPGPAASGSPVSGSSASRSGDGAGGTSAAQPFEETGPVFFDEDPSAGVADGPDAVPGTSLVPQEPASAWGADVSRQAGFGGEHDHRVSWGSPEPDPRVPGPSSPADPSELSAAPPTGLTGLTPLPGARSGADAGASVPAVPSPGPLPGPLPSRSVDESGRHGAPARQVPPVDGAAAVRALAAARRAKEQGDDGAPGDGAEGTLSIRAVPAQERRSASRGRLAAGAAPAALPGGPAQAPEAVPGRAAGPVPGAAPAAGATPWAQQVHALAETAGPAAQAPSPAASPAHSPSPFSASGPPGAEPPVVPWKPPKDDPFQAAARAQASARPAGLGRRFVARLIDSVVVGAVTGAVAVPLALRARTHIDGEIDSARQAGRTVTVYLLDGTTGVYLAVAVAALLVVGVLYEALPTARWGRTLGKRICRLTVRDIESFDPPGFRAALARWLLYGVLGLLVVGVLNVLWCLFDRPWRQCWHDKAAHTFVAGPTG
ncbi:RDD family protein [Streptomyces sp. 8L]|uniref:RDD family protein n=1 Tax=Streptomyces sp. 8L TaxID=2877242 RepID=UPI001CD5F859|nr:RDD family protein [Streptomyces sp. 8L]MCA1221691.1 RDD family protein [Streptomyces sp. 8L]